MQRETKVYGHFCLMARTMELLDDRWTVLVVRDLMLGRRRFTDLLARLGGISAKTLQQRLVDLEANGLVTVEREAGRRDVWYELTAAGADLTSALDEFTAWGIRHLRRPPMAKEPAHHEHIVTALRVLLSKTRPPKVAVSWMFHIDESFLCTLQFTGEIWRYIDGAVDSPDVIIESTTADFVRYFASSPLQRDGLAAGLTLTGTARHQRLFRTLTDRFPFGLD